MYTVFVYLNNQYVNICKKNCGDKSLSVTTKIQMIILLSLIFCMVPLFIDKLILFSTYFFLFTIFTFAFTSFMRHKCIYTKNLRYKSTPILTHIVCMHVMCHTVTYVYKM